MSCLSCSLFFVFEVVRDCGPVQFYARTCVLFPLFFCIFSVRIDISSYFYNFFDVLV